MSSNEVGASGSSKIGAASLPSDEPQTMFSFSSFEPQTMLSQSASEHSADEPHTTLSQSAPPQSVPQTTVSESSSVPHTTVSASSVPQTTVSLAAYDAGIRVFRVTAVDTDNNVAPLVERNVLVEASPNLVEVAPGRQVIAADSIRYLYRDSSLTTGVVQLRLRNRTVDSTDVLVMTSALSYVIGTAHHFLRERIRVRTIIESALTSRTVLNSTTAVA